MHLDRIGARRRRWHEPEMRHATAIGDEPQPEEKVQTGTDDDEKDANDGQRSQEVFQSVNRPISQSVNYQILTLCSGSRYSLSPGLTPNAS